MYQYNLPLDVVSFVYTNKTVSIIQVKMLPLFVGVAMPNFLASPGYG